MADPEASIDRTLDETTRDESARATDASDRPKRAALVLAWSRREPWRAGELCFAPRRAGDPPVILGRGASKPTEGVRGQWLRQRPGQNLHAEPLATKSLSREQLRVDKHGDGVALTNLGRCALVVGGEEVDRAVLRPGDVAHLGEQLTLMATARPLRMPPLRDAPEPAFEFGGADAFGIVGESPRIWGLRDRIAFIARRDLHVLVAGPSGSGKELATRAIHGQSRRADAAMVSRNAATIPAGLMDAELFGNVRDYPNPSMRARDGLIGLADGSTLFLDEIGEIPEELQAHLLRVLDAGGEYQRLGEDRTRYADLRVVAATNRDPSELKHDLVPRLTLRLTLPDLAEHPEDVPLLCQHLLRSHAEDDPELVERFADVVDGVAWFRLSPDLVEALLRHAHPQHVRGLVGLLWRCVQASPGRWIELAPGVERGVKRATREGSVRPDELDRDRVLAALEAHDWVIKATWPALGLRSRHQLRRLMKKMDLA